MDEMPVSELQMWLAFDLLDPFGSFRTDLNTAFVCSALTMGKGKIADFMPTFDSKKEPEPPPDIQEVSARMQGYFKQLTSPQQ